MTSKMFKKKNKFVLAVISLAALGLVLTSALGTIGLTSLGRNPNPSPNNQGTTGAIADLEYQIEQYQSSLEKSPNNIFVLTELGNSYYALGMNYSAMYREDKAKESFSKAVEPYGKVLETNPDNVNVRVDRAVSAFWSDNFELAEAEFEKSIEIDPTHAKAYFNYGIFLYLGQLKSNEALAMWNKVIELDTKDTDLINTTKYWISQIQEDQDGFIIEKPQQENTDDVPEENTETEAPKN